MEEFASTRPRRWSFTLARYHLNYATFDMARRFGSDHRFVELHDESAVVGKWAYSDKIYIGSMSGNILELSADTKDSLKFYTTRTGAFHSLAVSDIATSYDGGKIVTTSLDGTCFVSGVELIPDKAREIQCPEAISPHACIHRDGSLVAVVGAHGYFYIDNGSDTVSAQLNDEFFKAVSFYGQREETLTCLARHALAVIDPETQKAVAAVYGSTASSAGKLRKSLNCLAGHPDQSLVAVGTVTGYIEFYNLAESDEKVGDIKIGGQLVERMEFSEDGHTLAIAASNRKVLLMDMNTRTVSSSIDPQRSRVYSASFNRDMDKLISVSEDKTVVIAPVIDIDQ
jgi:WD40 repeat protein